MGAKYITLPLQPPLVTSGAGLSVVQATPLAWLKARFSCPDAYTPV